MNRFVGEGAELRYDPEVDALRIRLRKGEIEQSTEPTEGLIFDWDKEGNMVAIEVLDLSQFANDFTTASNAESPSAVPA